MITRLTLVMAASLAIAACEPITHEPWEPCDLDTALLDTLGEEPEDCTDSKYGAEECLVAALEEGAAALAFDVIDEGFRLARAVDAEGDLWEFVESGNYDATYSYPVIPIVVQRQLCISPRVDGRGGPLVCDEWAPDERVCPIRD